MSMKRVSLLAPIVAAFLLGGVGQAQEMSVEAWDELRSLQKQIVEGRDAIVKENLSLSDAEKEKFLALYEEYRTAVTGLQGRTEKLVEAYAEHVETMDEAKAEALMKEWLAIETDSLALRKRYAKKIRRVLPAQKTVRFFQIESKLDAIMDLDLTLRIPLVE